MFLNTPPVYRYAAAPVVRQYTLTATLPYGVVSRVRVDNGIRSVFRFERGAFADYDGRQMPVCVGHVLPSIGMGLLTDGAEALQLSLELSDDNAAHRDLIEAAVAGRLSGISPGARDDVGRTERDAAGVLVKTVTWVANLVEVSVIRWPDLPTCFSSVSVSEKRTDRW